MTAIFCGALLPMLSPAQELKPDRRFTDWDSNKDGKLTREELPERNRKFFGRVDIDKDGFISLKEHLDFVRGLPRNRSQPRAPQGVKLERNIATPAPTIRARPSTWRCLKHAPPTSLWRSSPTSTAAGGGRARRTAASTGWAPT